MEQYYKPHPYYNYIHRMHSNNPSCSSMHGAYQSDPLLFDIKGESFTLILIYSSKHFKFYNNLLSYSPHAAEGII